MPALRLALAIGDPAGIGPELAAKLLADDEVRAATDLIVIGDARVLRRATEVAGVNLNLPTVTKTANLPPDGTVMLDLGHLDPDTIQTGVAAKAGGQFALENFRVALRLAADDVAGAVCFTPFNKSAMHMARHGYDDEIGFIAEVLEDDSLASEFNILEGLWNARVTSHVPLSAVAGLITRERVLSRIELTDANLRGSGLPNPRIGVAGLNPHAGDSGNFGHEDDGEIAPAVADAKAKGINAEGPFPPDTVFVRARRGEFDAVLTMYHDQGQIAMKLMGFDKGVTLIGGYKMAICTPAHGSAYDIAGKGIANIGASKAAVLLAAKMAAR